jgi:membrane protein DedA with SNARE-associated domain
VVGVDGALWMTLALVGVTTLPPLVPNSALIATAGALAAAGRIPLPLLLLTVAGSALAGDALVYWLGRRTGRRTRRWLSASPRRTAALEWTADNVQRYGVPFVIAVRFLPSGRIVGGLATGTVGYSARRFVLGSGVAELLWAGYSVGVGYWGGSAPVGMLSGALIGLGASVVLAGIAGAAQWVLGRGSTGRRATARGPVVQWTSPGAASVVPPQGDAASTGLATGAVGAAGGTDMADAAGTADMAGVSGGMPDITAESVPGSASQPSSPTATPVPRPSGDPLADGVGEPVRPASFHQVR